MITCTCEFALKELKTADTRIFNRRLSNFLSPFALSQRDAFVTAPHCYNDTKKITLVIHRRPTYSDHLPSTTEEETALST